VENLEIPGNGGSIPVRLYAPDTAPKQAALVYLHGGRFFSGDLESHDTVCRILARDSRCSIMAVDYRLAPEHKFPAALEDTWSAAQWLSENAASVGVDPGRIGIGGDSAGGNLAAAAAVLSRERGGPKLRCQMLIYPMLDATCGLASHIECSSGYGPASDDMKRGYREYLPDGANWKDPRISPFFTQELSGLPPAFVLTAEFDSLRDEGDEYARRLERAAVPVTHCRIEGAIHGILQMSGTLDLGRKTAALAADFLRQTL
jgi:acetyl esterase